MNTIRGGKALDWKKIDASAQFLELFYSIAEEKIKTKEEFQKVIENIEWEEKELVQGVDPRIIRFLEFAFALSGRLDSPLYPLTKKVLKKLFEWSPELKALLNATAADAIGNIILESRGRIAFRIEKAEDVDQLIEDWNELGLKDVNKEKVFVAILNKPTIRQKILKGNLKVRYLLNKFFPEYCKVFPLLQLSEEEKKEIETFIQNESLRKREYEHEQEDINELIKIENEKAKYYLGRNYRLSFLIKKKHNFQCQICKALKNLESDIEAKAETNEGDEDKDKEKQLVEAHHLIPLEEGGEDISENIIIVCPKHHKMFHEKQIKFHSEGEDISIEFMDGRRFTIKKN